MTATDAPTFRLIPLLLKDLRGDADKYLSAPSSVEDLVRFLAFDVLSEHPDIWNNLQELARQLKPFGVDVKKHLADVDRAAKAETPAAAKKGAKGKKR